MFHDWYPAHLQSGTRPATQADAPGAAIDAFEVLLAFFDGGGPGGRGDLDDHPSPPGCCVDRTR
ncbi:MAG: hypothetical protein HC860_12360 [Alkalinema sp. RU_4_3]|nr:hypothetical protein [Alkalinema sp. RU_4_3]